MGNIIFSILTLAGALGLFLFGMKIMSEGLQKLAGDRMRNILAAMTSTPLTRICTGLLITAVIQSSSATTVMIVSFVNAGLLTLTQSVGVIMGANIGTTLTAWIISLLGFKADISMLALPIIGIGFPLMMLKGDNKKNIGEFIVGFALLFIGLGYLKASVPDIGQNPEILAFLQNFANPGYLSILIFVLIGTVLTVIIQSSSATMALTLVMCSNGWISFDLACAMILGENIGTTITANIAATVGNVSAKRAARAHFIFNVFGIVWMLIAFFPFLKLISFLIAEFGGSLDPASGWTAIVSMPIGLSLFHTLFNVTNTLVLVWFTPLIVKTVTKMVKQPPETEEIFRLKFIKNTLLSTAELSLHEAKQEIGVYGKRTTQMFGMVRQMLMETNDDKFEEIYLRVEKYEEISDRMEIEIADYLNKVSEGDLSEESRMRLHAMYRMISETESIADSCLTLAKTLKLKKSGKVWFDEDMRKNLNDLFDLVDVALAEMNANVEKGYSKLTNIRKATSAEGEINKKSALLNQEHLSNLEDKKYAYNAGVIYSDIVSEAERLADHVINVSEAIYEINENLRAASNI
ncbi:MAG: Na/Pi cotransporter family protein [Prevotellaceae bacterium]|jgi:phosphate:Na+ symporter|nr:Na/Pi cotransporter family protein [Prevotellaceae bacterium]